MWNKGVLAQGDFVAVQWSARGTHQHPIAHLPQAFSGPPTGKTVTLTGVALFRFEGDTLGEVWNHWDRHHLLEQLGAAPDSQRVTREESAQDNARPHLPQKG